MVRWVIEMYIEVAGDYKFMRCGGSDRKKGIKFIQKKRKRFREGRWREWTIDIEERDFWLSVYLQPLLRNAPGKQPPLRRSRSFKVTDYGTSRKIIYDFLLVINSKLTSYLAPFPSYGWLFVKFSLARGECLTLTLSLGVIPRKYRHKWYITKTWFLGLHFCHREYRCISNHFYVIRHESYGIRWNYVEVTAIQGHLRSPILVPMESSYATSY